MDVVGVTFYDSMSHTYSTSSMANSLWKLLRCLLPDHGLSPSHFHLPNGVIPTISITGPLQPGHTLFVAACSHDLVPPYRLPASNERMDCSLLQSDALKLRGLFVCRSL